MEQSLPKEEGKTSEMLQSYVYTLRWGPKKLRSEGRVYLKIKQFAKMLAVSCSKVRDLLALASGDRPR